MLELTNDEWTNRISEIDEIARQNILNEIDEKCYAFLDFDGVINLWNRPIEEDGASIKESEFQFLDKDCMKRLSDFCYENNIYLVISSSWRFKGLEYCRQYLQQGGLHPDIPIVGTTALDYDDRELHITDYLLEHRDFTSYMIFDDMNLPHLSSHEIMCETQYGFDEEKLGEATFMVRKIVDMGTEYKVRKEREVMIQAILEGNS